MPYIDESGMEMFSAKEYYEAFSLEYTLGAANFVIKIRNLSGVKAEILLAIEKEALHHHNNRALTTEEGCCHDDIWCPDCIFGDGYDEDDIQENDLLDAVEELWYICDDDDFKSAYSILRH